MKMLACQCEHVAHMRDANIHSRTPNGNHGHIYGIEYSDTYMCIVKTPWGSFTICKDCSDDCYANFERTCPNDGRPSASPSSNLCGPCLLGRKVKS